MKLQRSAWIERDAVLFCGIMEDGELKVNVNHHIRFPLSIFNYACLLTPA